MTSLIAGPFCGFVRRVGVSIAVATALALTPVIPISAAVLPPAVTSKTVATTGSATNTITNLQFLSDTTIAIEADVVGQLTHFGKFTGTFEYVAEFTDYGILLVGTATLTNHKGDTLSVTALINEYGAVEPFDVVGTL